MRRLIICFCLLFFTNLVCSQNSKDNHVEIIDSLDNSPSYEQYVLNEARDTIFYLHAKKDSFFINRDFYFVRDNKLWMRKDLNSNFTEKGKFKKRRFRGLFRMPVKYFKHRKNKFLYCENKKYYPMVKVGRWEYFNNKGELVEYYIYDRDGFKITCSINK